jgi:hypothetical protein
MSASYHTILFELASKYYDGNRYNAFQGRNYDFIGGRDESVRGLKKANLSTFTVTSEICFLPTEYTTAFIFSGPTAKALAPKCI